MEKPSQPPQSLAPNLRRQINNQKGVALLLTTACMMLMLYVSLEVTYDTSVEFLVNANAIQRLKSYYAAKSAMDISLLRIKIYQLVNSKFGSELGPKAQMLEQIWRFPFAWPPPALPEMSKMDKDSINKTAKESIMDASYLATIEDEGSKIDLNDLNSKSEVIRKNTHKQLVNIFESHIQDDEDFRKEYGTFRFDELINNIADWMSRKIESYNGGDKKKGYSEFKSDDFPPNRAFRTIQEVRMVAGMTDELFEILEPRVTIYGMMGINPNLASKEVLRSLDVGITSEIADEIIKRRDNDTEGGYFSKSKEFWDFVVQKGARLQNSNPEQDIPLVFETATNFRIKATGTFGKSSKEITAIVFNINQAAKNLKSVNDKLKQEQEAGSKSDPQNPNDPSKNPTSAATNKQKNEKLPKGPPRIVYWNER